MTCGKKWVAQTYHTNVEPWALPWSALLVLASLRRQTEPGHRHAQYAIATRSAYGRYLTMVQRSIKFLINQYIERMDPSMEQTASWYKLKTGKWGVRIRHEGQAGTELEVSNKEGKVSNVTLLNRVAKFDDAELWEIE